MSVWQDVQLVCSSRPSQCVSGGMACSFRWRLGCPRWLLGWEWICRYQNEERRLAILGRFSGSCKYQRNRFFRPTCRWSRYGWPIRRFNNPLRLVEHCCKWLNERLDSIHQLDVHRAWSVEYSQVAGAFYTVHSRLGWRIEWKWKDRFIFSFRLYWLCNSNLVWSSLIRWVYRFSFSNYWSKKNAGAEWTAPAFWCFWF